MVEFHHKNATPDTAQRCQWYLDFWTYQITEYATFSSLLGVVWVSIVSICEKIECVETMSNHVLSYVLRWNRRYIPVCHSASTMLMAGCWYNAHFIAMMSTSSCMWKIIYFHSPFYKYLNSFYIIKQSGTKPNLAAKILATKFGFVPDCLREFGEWIVSGLQIFDEIKLMYMIIIKKIRCPINAFCDIIAKLFNSITLIFNIHLSFTSTGSSLHPILRSHYDFFKII